MANQRISLAVMLSTAIAAGSLFVGSAAAIECPLFKSRSSENSSQRPNVPDQSGQSSVVKRDIAPQSSRSLSSLQSSNSAKAGIVGLVAITSLLATSIAYYKLRSARQTTTDADTPLSNHPELEHPELVLTMVPREALTQVSDDRVLSS
jgi:hypothetical protein